MFVFEFAFSSAVCLFSIFPCICGMNLNARIMVIRTAGRSLCEQGNVD